MTGVWRRFLLACIVAANITGTATVLADETEAEAQEAVQRVEIADPFIELHTGAGAVYPVFHVVDRGETVVILKRKIDWFKVRTDRDIEGWVALEQMQRTLNPDGSVVAFTALTRDDFNQREWEGGILGGDFGGAAVLSVYGAYHFTSNISTEVSLSHAIGDFSNSIILSVNVLNQPFPEWEYSPFFTLGTGVINTEPNATLVASEDRTDEILHAGFGVRTFLGRRFVLRAEYKKYTVITSRDDND
ncbi:MAG: SH3 domain-containing protein, partial [Pseudomonadota bacterium]